MRIIRPPSFFYFGIFAIFLLLSNGSATFRCFGLPRRKNTILAFQLKKELKQRYLTPFINGNGNDSKKNNARVSADNLKQSTLSKNSKKNLISKKNKAHTTTTKHLSSPLSSPIASNAKGFKERIKQHFFWSKDSIKNETKEKRKQKPLTIVDEKSKTDIVSLSKGPTPTDKQSLSIHNAAMIEYYHQHTRYHLFKWHKSKQKRDLNNAVKHNLKLNNELYRVKDLPKRLLYIEQLIWSLRTVTNGIMLPRSDGRYEELGRHEIDLINAFTPPLLKTLSNMERTYQQTQNTDGKKKSFEAEGMLDLNKFTQVQLYIAELLGFQISAVKDNTPWKTLNVGENSGLCKQHQSSRMDTNTVNTEGTRPFAQKRKQNYLAMTSMLPHVKRMSNNIESSVKNAPHIDSGMPYIIKGMYYMNCPRPLRNMDKAKENFLKALRVDSKSGRNHYFVGVMAFMDGNYDGALSHFHKASAILKHSSDHERNYFLPELENGIKTIHLIKKSKSNNKLRVLKGESDASK